MNRAISALMSSLCFVSATHAPPPNRSFAVLSTWSLLALSRTVLFCVELLFSFVFLLWLGPGPHRSCWDEGRDDCRIRLGEEKAEDVGVGSGWPLGLCTCRVRWGVTGLLPADTNNATMDLFSLSVPPGLGIGLLGVETLRFLRKPESGVEGLLASFRGRPGPALLGNGDSSAPEAAAAEAATAAAAAAAAAIAARTDSPPSVPSVAQETSAAAAAPAAAATAARACNLSKVRLSIGTLTQRKELSASLSDASRPP